MHSIKSTSILWLGAAVLSLSAACVDDNKAPPPVMKPPAVGACGEGVKAVTVPIFTAGTGTPVVYEPNKPPASPTIVYSEPNPKKENKPGAIAETGEGTYATASLCPAVTHDITVWLGGFTDAAKLATLTTPVVDDKKPFLIVSAGVVDKAAATKHGVAVADPAYKLFAVDMTKFTKDKTQLIVVNASLRLPDPATVEIGGVVKPAPRFGQSETFDLAIDPQHEKPLTLTFKSGDVTKTATIGPRYPTGTQGVAILYDSIENDPMVKAEDAPDSSSLFVTAGDDLFQALPATGVTFEVADE